MNALLFIGTIMLLGTFAGKLFRRINLPQVTGYIMIGLLLGPVLRKIPGGPDVGSFGPVISLALGIIGFMIGSELQFQRFKRYSRSIYTILFFEALLAFAFVAMIVTFVTGQLYMGLLLGALASATAPASTYSVLGEYKARGPLTMTTFSVIALDDALALVLYGFVVVFARSILTNGHFSLLSGMVRPVLQILASAGIGVAAGYALDHTVRKMTDRDMMLPFAFGTIVLVVGAAMALRVEPILACMALGAVAVNLHPAENREVFDVIKNFSSPVFVLFFVLIGMGVDMDVVLRGGFAVLVVVYIVARSSGKLLGAHIGGRLSRARRTVTDYLGFCLLDQAGIAVGLAIATFHSFSEIGGDAYMAGLMIVNVITVTTFLQELVAPSLVRFAVRRADEAGRNVTERDIIAEYKVGEVMDEDFFVIKENYDLHQMIELMKRSKSYVFPVLGMDGEFKGVISLGAIREAFHEDQLDALILAKDLVRKVDVAVHHDQPLSEAMDIFQRKNTDYLPVLSSRDKGRLIGQLNYRYLRDRISRETLLRQHELET